MSKYKTLLKEYKEEIDEIKEIKAAMKVLATEANQYVGLDSDRTGLTICK